MHGKGNEENKAEDEKKKDDGQHEGKTTHSEHKTLENIYKIKKNPDGKSTTNSVGKIHPKMEKDLPRTSKKKKKKKKKHDGEEKEGTTARTRKRKKTTILQGTKIRTQPKTLGNLNHRRNNRLRS